MNRLQKMYQVLRNKALEKRIKHQEQEQKEEKNELVVSNLPSVMHHGDLTIYQGGNYAPAEIKIGLYERFTKVDVQEDNTIIFYLSNSSMLAVHANSAINTYVSKTLYLNNDELTDILLSIELNIWRNKLVIYNILGYQRVLYTKDGSFSIFYKEKNNNWVSVI